MLGWYDQHRRDLPWRETRDPYRIWLSEIMLQQTRVAAVIDHYRIFLQRFPDIQTLAASSEDAVLAAWSGLGYYRRARMLHRCAQQIVREHSGQFPQTSADLLKLPGIGRYTAAAIASIVFAKPVAVVDGNVERVLQRLIGNSLTMPQIWEHADALLDHSRPGDFNQAMMELGATVCVPGEPGCNGCPVRKWCSTRGVGPSVPSTSRQSKKEIWCVLDWRQRNGARDGDGEVRLVKRPKKASLMPGMWELPQSFKALEPLTDAPPWRTFRHSITVTDYTVHVLRNTTLRRTTLPGTTSRSTRQSSISLTTKSKWIARDRITQLPITGLTRKVLKAGGII